MKSLKNKVVVITGSSHGIGEQTAYQFAKEKCKIVVTYYVAQKEGKKVAKKCKELGASKVLLQNLDVTNNKSIKTAVKNIIDEFHKIDILINNAGAVIWKPLRKQSLEDIEKQIRTNLEGLIKMTGECLPFIKESIINIASGAGKTAYSDLTAYCATKFGVIGFTQALSQELSNIKVYAVNPGLTATRMTDFAGDDPAKVAKVILNTAKGEYGINSGGDVDVWKYLE